MRLSLRLDLKSIGKVPAHCPSIAVMSGSSQARGEGAN